jgi:ribonuclease-3
VSGEAGCVEALERATGHRFARLELAETALAHPSYAHETDGSRGNERLEFLGDAVLDLVIARVLFERRPSWTEGQLTRVRASLVNKQSLAARARELGLRELVKLGRTEQSSGRDKESILANCFEAVVGAVYLDGGLEAVEPLVGRCFGEELSQDRVPRDAKTAFQEWTHAEHRLTPRYRTVADTGLENDDDRFTVEVVVGEESWGRGVGRTKRAAETAAAEAGLARAGARA